MNESLYKEYLKILDIDETSSLEDIRKAYKVLVQVWHPDRFQTNPVLKDKTEKKLKEINNAYEYITQNYHAYKAYRETENNSKSSEYSYSSSEYSYSSQNYQDSNTKNESRNETDNSIKNEQLIKAIEKHFIYQSRKRLGILIFITSGLYIVYWYYKHWALFKEYQKDSRINLIICSIFYNFSILGLARRIKKLSLEIETEEEIETKKKSIPFDSLKPVNLLGLSFSAGFFASSVGRLPFPLNLLSDFFFIYITDIIYQGLLSCIEKYLDEKKKLSFLSGGFIGWTIFGIILWSIYIIGSLSE